MCPEQTVTYVSERSRRRIFVIVCSSGDVDQLTAQQPCDVAMMASAAGGTPMAREALSWRF